MRHLDHYDGPEPNRVIAETLKRRGGKTPTGYPLYRLVHSAHVFETVGGNWHQWDDNLNIADRGGITGEDGMPVESYHRPDKVEAAMVTNCKYAHLETHGWMLQRWQPASFFGSPEEWERRVVPGTQLPIHGAYPHEGQYIEINGPYPLEPGMQYLEDVIASWESRWAAIPLDVELWIKMEVERVTKRQEAMDAKAIEYNRQRLIDSTAPITSTSLEAGRWRDQMFKRAGYTSHIGN